MPFENALFFEGKNDLYPVGHLLDLETNYETEFWKNKAQATGRVVGLQEFGGYSELRSGFPIALRQEASLLRVGIVADADDNPEGRWESLRDALRRVCVSVDLPTRTPEEGWVGNAELADRIVRTGIWIMPDNREEGAAENWLLRMIPNDDPLLPRARACLSSVPSDERKFKDVHETKALVRTWLAWQEEPGQALGESITSEYFDTESDAALQFLGWIQRLFEANG